MQLHQNHHSPYIQNSPGHIHRTRPVQPPASRHDGYNLITHPQQLRRHHQSPVQHPNMTRDNVFPGFGQGKDSPAGENIISQGAAIGSARRHENRGGINNRVPPLAAGQQLSDRRIKVGGHREKVGFNYKEYPTDHHKIQSTQELDQRIENLRIQRSAEHYPYQNNSQPHPRYYNGRKNEQHVHPHPSELRRPFLPNQEGNYTLNTSPKIMGSQTFSNHTTNHEIPHHYQGQSTSWDTHPSQQQWSSRDLHQQQHYPSQYSQITEQHYHMTNENRNHPLPEQCFYKQSPPSQHQNQHYYGGHNIQYLNSYHPEQCNPQRNPHSAQYSGYARSELHDNIQLASKHSLHPPRENYYKQDLVGPSHSAMKIPPCPPSGQVQIPPPSVPISQPPKSQVPPQHSLVYETSSHPTPQRQHSGASAKSQDSFLPPRPLTAPSPVTKRELDELRERVNASNDQAVTLTYAKKLVEAAETLSNDRGRTDEKQARRQKENYTLEALKLIKRLVSNVGNKPYPPAMFFLAICYGSGQLGLQIDHEKAFHLYQSAAKLDHPPSAYRIAVCYEVGAGTKKDFSKAFLAYRNAASLGNTASMYKLGMVSLSGLLNQEKDFTTGVSWLTKAAKQADVDNPHALHEMGLLIERPDASRFGLQQNPQLAFNYFMEAAKLYYAPSMFKLGSCFEHGTLGCPVNAKRSVAWYTRAAEKGHSESELALSGWYLTGADCLKQNDTEAYLWAKKAAEQGLPKAEFAVGYYTEEGIGCQSDLEQAKKWYVRAASQGQKQAQDRLMELKRSGNLYRRPAPVTRAQIRQDTESCLVM